MQHLIAKGTAYSSLYAFTILFEIGKRETIIISEVYVK